MALQKVGKKNGRKSPDDCVGPPEFTDEAQTFTLNTDATKLYMPLHRRCQILQNLLTLAKTVQKRESLDQHQCNKFIFTNTMAKKF